MRKQLKKINGQRLRFRAVVERFGSKKNYHGFPTLTILLKDVLFVKDEKMVCDHIWFSVGKTIENLMLQPDDVIEFDARVSEYLTLPTPLGWGFLVRRDYLL